MRRVTAVVVLIGFFMMGNSAYASELGECPAGSELRYILEMGGFVCVKKKNSSSGKDVRMDGRGRQVEGSGLPLRGGQPPLR